MDLQSDGDCGGDARQLSDVSIAGAWLLACPSKVRFGTDALTVVVPAGVAGGDVCTTQHGALAGSDRAGATGWQQACESGTPAASKAPVGNITSAIASKAKPSLEAPDLTRSLYHFVDVWL